MPNVKTVEPELLKELCQVCNRVPFGDIVRLGFGRWRHDCCAGGSQSWLENFHSIEHPTSEQRILFDTLSVSKNLPDAIHIQEECTHEED